MKMAPACVGARGVDSLPFSQGGTSAQALALKLAGIDFVVGYLGVINSDRLHHVIENGMGFMPVTLAGAYDGHLTVERCAELHIPSGTTVWLDCEGMAAFNTPAAELIAKIDTWADTVNGGGYLPGLYVGSPQPLTSDELWNLRVRRYWNALSREQDRRGALAEPKCGWCMWQMNPSVMWRDTGVWVDVNMIGQDFLSRVPTWAVAE